jgi:hypothetical protein
MSDVLNIFVSIAAVVSCFLQVGPLCKYVNNHTKFAVLLSDAVDEWGAELPEKLALALSDKVDFTCTMFIENSSRGVESIAQQMYSETRDILKVRLIKQKLVRHFFFPFYCSV